MLNAAWSVCLSVCMLGTTVSCAKMARLNQDAVWGHTHGPKVLDWITNGSGTFEGRWCWDFPAICQPLLWLAADVGAADQLPTSMFYYRVHITKQRVLQYFQSASLLSIFHQKLKFHLFLTILPRYYSV